MDTATRKAWIGSRWRFPALCFLLLLGFLLQSGLAGERPAPGPEARPVLSLLAVGDTGTRRARHDGQLQVAAAMRSEDLRSSVDGLVLLGDNFYPTGLRKSELEERLVENLIQPYCRFVELSSAWRNRVRECPGDPGDRRHRPLWAILGNHDHQDPDSPELQRNVVPGIISNWEMPEGIAGVYELAGGVSLILYDSTPLRMGTDPTPLLEAIARSRGPWRIVAGHHPLAPEAEPERPTPTLPSEIRGAIAGLGTTVHVLLAGHQHNLQAIALAEPALGLEAIAGGGSTARAIKGSPSGRLFAQETRGFVRIDLVQAREEYLRVSFIAVPRRRLPWSRTRRVAAFAVASDGRVTRTEPPLRRSP